MNLHERQAEMRARLDTRRAALRRMTRVIPVLLVDAKPIADNVLRPRVRREHSKNEVLADVRGWGISTASSAAAVRKERSQWKKFVDAIEKERRDAEQAEEDQRRAVLSLQRLALDT